MAIHVEKTMRFKVTAEKAWETVDDFGAIYKFSPTVKSSPIVNDINRGLGSKRKTVFYNDDSLIEEIVGYEKGKSMTVKVLDPSSPLKSSVAKMIIKKVDAETSDLTFSMDFEMKWGPLGWLLGNIMLRPVFKGIFKKQVLGWAYHTMTGNSVGDKVPSK